MKPLLRLLAITGALMFLFSGSALAKCCGGEDIPDAQECCSEVPVPPAGFCCGGKVYTDNSLQCCHDLGAYNPNEEMCCPDGPVTKPNCGPGKHPVCTSGASEFGACECDNPLPDEPCKIWNSSTCHLDELGTAAPSNSDESIDPSPQTDLAGLNSTFIVTGKQPTSVPFPFCKDGQTVTWTAGTPVWAWTSSPTGNIVGDADKETVQLKTTAVSTAANDKTLSYTCTIIYTASVSGVSAISKSSHGSGTYTVVKIMSQTNETTPPDRTRTKIGIGEGVYLTIEPYISGSMNWSVTPTEKASLYSPSGSSNSLTAGHENASITVTVEKGGKVITDLNMSIIEPTGVMMETIASSIAATATPRLRLEYQADIYILPDDVNFSRITISEGTCPAIVSDYFGYQSAKNHVAWPSPFDLDSVTAGKGTKAFTPDTISGATRGPTYGPGSFTWKIPWRYHMGSEIKEFKKVDQVKTLQILSTGKARLRITKAGTDENVDQH